MITFNGVRSSWDIAAINSDFAWLASWSSWFIFPSSAVFWFTCSNSRAFSAATPISWAMDSMSCNSSRAKWRFSLVARWSTPTTFSFAFIGNAAELTNPIELTIFRGLSCLYLMSFCVSSKTNRWPVWKTFPPTPPERFRRFIGRIISSRSPLCALRYSCSSDAFWR